MMSDYGVKPVYEKIEFCRNAKTLWGKLQSGRWGWLGVHPNGQFVLGSPRQGKGSTMMGAGPSSTVLPTLEAQSAASLSSWPRGNTPVSGPSCLRGLPKLRA